MIELLNNLEKFAKGDVLIYHPSHGKVGRGGAMVMKKLTTDVIRGRIGFTQFVRVMSIEKRQSHTYYKCECIPVSEKSLREYTCTLNFPFNKKQIQLLSRYFVMYYTSPEKPSPLRVNKTES